MKPFETQREIHDFLFNQGRKIADNSKWNNAIAEYKKVATKAILSSIELHKRINEIEEEELIRNREEI